MYSSAPSDRTLFFISGIPFLFGTLLFAFYTVRLIWLNLTVENAAAYRSATMLMAAVGFPLAAIIFGLITRYFFRQAMRSTTTL